MRTVIHLHFIGAVLGVLAAGCVVEVHPLELCGDDDRCDVRHYCEFSEGRACGRGGALGLCLARPEVCPDYVDPVCGCDGLSYGNACEAHTGGVDVAREGRCDDVCVAQDAYGSGLCRVLLGWFWDGTSCVAQSGCYCEGIDCARGWDTVDACRAAHTTCVEPARCGGGASCAADEWCDWPDASMCGGAGAIGVCRDRPSACPAIYGPICGCDGVTYGNSCEANAAGADFAYGGPCEAGEICGGFAGFVCASTMFCDFPPGAACGAADQTGVCRERPHACIEIYSPVCACDGQTYSNECFAESAGVDVAYDGACADGGRCGGLGPATCGATEWCDVVEGTTCDAPGVCRPRPDTCPAYESPVCGCDGVTYGNACGAESAGTDVAYSGPCAALPDCRTAGCAAGASCQACLTATGVGWVCLPSGAVC